MRIRVINAFQVFSVRPGNGATGTDAIPISHE
jgi:hypothetical protein